MAALRQRAYEWRGSDRLFACRTVSFFAFLYRVNRSEIQTLYLDRSPKLLLPVPFFLLLCAMLPVILCDT